MAKLFKVLKSRTVLVGLAILIQAAWYILFLRQLTSYSVFINGFFRILSVVIVLYLIRKDENSAYKIGMGHPDHAAPAVGWYPVCAGRKQEAKQKDCPERQWSKMA